MCYILEKQTRFNITHQIALHRIGGNELTVDSRKLTNARRSFYLSPLRRSNDDAVYNWLVGISRL
jgi:hypothetical protein